MDSLMFIINNIENSSTRDINKNKNKFSIVASFVLPLKLRDTKSPRSSAFLFPFLCSERASEGL